MEHIYVVSTQSMIDYDFSVVNICHGAFRSLDNATTRFLEAVEDFKAKHRKELEKFADAEIYPDEGAGALVIREDVENGYWYCQFGYQDDHETHVICIDKIAMED